VTLSAGCSWFENETTREGRDHSTKLCNKLTLPDVLGLGNVPSVGDRDDVELMVPSLGNLGSATVLTEGQSTLSHSLRCFEYGKHHDVGNQGYASKYCAMNSVGHNTT